MAQPRTGRGSFLGYAEDDTSYGNAAASPTAYARVFSAGIANTFNLVPVGTLSDADNGSEVGSHHVVNEQTIAGVVEVPLMAEGQGLLLKHAMWAVATTGSGPYTHTFTLGSSRPALGLTLEQGIGSVSDTFPGARVSKMVIKGEVGNGVCRASFDFIAQAPSMSRDASPSTPTYTTNEAASRIEWWRGATASIAGNAYKIESFEFTLDRRLEQLRSISSLVTDDPAASDRPTVTGKFRLAKYDDQLYTDYATSSPSAANVTLTLTKGSKSIAFTLHSALITSYTESRDAGPTTIDIEVTAQSSSGSSGFAIVIVNSQSSATAA